MSTPALDRAAEEFREHRAEFSENDTPPSCTGCDFVTPFDKDGEWDHPAFHAHRITATVSAALHDPDDPLWLERVLVVAGYEGRDQADAVRAAILGEAS